MSFHRKKDKNTKIVNINDYRGKIEFNLGIIIFGIVFIYMLGTIFIYLTTPHISYYEIQKGTILEDTQYTGLILRDEAVYYSDNAGYVEYFKPEGSHVTTSSGIYQISPTDISKNNTSVINMEINDDIIHDIEKEIQNYNASYSNLKFDDIYTLKNSIQEILYSSNAKERNNNASNSANQITSAGKGNISYNIDGYEGITAMNVTSENISASQYKKNMITTGTQVTTGAPIYKIISGETWSLIIEVSENDYARLQDMSSVTVKILEDNVQMRAKVTLMEQDGKIFAKLDFDSGMLRYISDRFIDVELIFASISGFKVPVSAITTKDFYEIPIEYILLGGDSSSKGVLLEQEDGSTKFTKINIYHSTDKYAYILAESFEEAITIIQPEDAEKLRLSQTVEMTGVYNINKGYAIFECVQILTENEEYYIISDSNTWSVKNYDHIVLDSSIVEINDIAF